MHTVLNKVVLKPDPIEEKKIRGIVIPDSAHRGPSRGTVVCVGPGREGEPMGVKEGDIVVYPERSGYEVFIDGVEYRVLSQIELLMVNP